MTKADNRIFGYLLFLFRDILREQRLSSPLVYRSICFYSHSLFLFERKVYIIFIMCLHPFAVYVNHSMHSVKKNKRNDYQKSILRAIT